MKQHEAKYWMGSDPKNCDICKKKLGDSFVDGATTMRAWAIMCKVCFKAFGIGLGTGRGQRYEQQADKRWLKVQ